VLSSVCYIQIILLFLVCGPPPTAYDPKHPFGTGVISFPKGDRFPQGSTPNHLPPPQDATVIKLCLFMLYQLTFIY
jgi:hypothetical protein